MARVVKFEGRNISVPDDATDDEVAQIIGGGAPAAPASIAGKVYANPAGRFGLGVAKSAILGPLEYLSHGADKVRGGIRQAEVLATALQPGGSSLAASLMNYYSKNKGVDVGPKVTEYIQGIEDEKKKGMTEQGPWVNAVGNVGEFAGQVAPWMLTGGPKVTGSLKDRTGASALEGMIQAASTPVGDTSVDFDESKSKQILTGGAISGAFPGASDALKAVGKTGRRIFDATIKTEGGVARLAKERWQHIIGERDMGAVRAAALKARAPFKGADPTLADAMVDVPEGTAVQAQQRVTAGTHGGISSDFNKRLEGQQSAIEDEWSRLKSESKAWRDEPLKAATKAQEKIKQIQDEIVSLTDKKSQNEVTKYRLDSLGHTMESQAQDVSPVSGLPRAPGRYTPHQAVANDARAASGEVESRLVELRTQLGTAKKELTAIKSQGIKPLDPEKLKSSADSLRSSPGIRADQRVRAAMDSFKAQIDAVKKEFGEVRVEDLYEIRKNLGREIESSLKGNNPVAQKRLMAKLQNELQDEIDKVISSAGGGKAWADYLKKYSERASAIDAFKDQIERKYSPLQQTNLPDASNIVGQAAPKGPGMISREMTAANWISRMLRQNIEPSVDRAMADQMLDPSLFVKAMDKLPLNQRNFYIKELTDSLQRRLATGATIGSANSQKE